MSEQTTGKLSGGDRPAKRDELIAECHGRFQVGFPEGFRFVWLEQSEQFRTGFAAAIDHAFAAGVSRPQWRRRSEGRRRVVARIPLERTRRAELFGVRLVLAPSNKLFR